MAKPDGAVTAGSYYYDVTPAGVEDPQYQYLLAFIPWQPPHLCDAKKGERLMVAVRRSQVLVVDADQDLNEDVWCGEQDKTFDLTHAGQIATATYQSADTQSNYPDWTKVFLRYPTGEETDKPMFVEIEQKIWSNTDDGDDTVYHHAVHYIYKPDSVTLEGDGLALFDHAGATDIHYAPDYPVSAWHVMRAMCDNYEALTLFARPSFCCLSLGDENS